MTAPTWRAHPPGGLDPGEATFRPWRRVRELGRGNMGAVWEVAHEQTGERRALKVLLVTRDRVTEDDLVRFQREAELAARLDHPHLARVHGWQLDPWPPWMVLDLLPGGSLAERLQQGPLPPEEARRIAVQLADGLAHAHALGILHRDLKPGNVMFDAEGRALITDFGLARGALMTDQGLTRTGEVLGTPVYMAPEQAKDAKHVDERCDVYGLGAILYAMLTARPPVQATGNLIQVLEEVITRPPLLPSRLVQGIPSALEDVVLRALTKDPDLRYGSALELKQALEAAAPGSPSAAGVSRRRLLLRAGGLLGGGLLLGAAGGLLARRRGAAPVAPDPAPQAPAQLPAGSAGPVQPVGPWTVVHTHGWRTRSQQLWLSLVLKVEAPGGAAGPRRVELRRARLLHAHEGRAQWWDTSPAAQQTGGLEGPGTAALAGLLGQKLELPASATEAPAAGDWDAALRLLLRQLGELVPGIAQGSWGERLRAARLRERLIGWERLRPAAQDDDPTPGAAARGEPGAPPLWAVDDAGDGVEALAALEAICPLDLPGRLHDDGPEPVDDLASDRQLLRGYLTALNALTLLYWEPTLRDVLLVPGPRSLPGLDDLQVGPTPWRAGTPPPGQVRSAGQAVAHGWPWGIPLGVLPTQARYLRLFQRGEWVAIAWGGGVAYVPAQDLQPADGPLARVTTRESPAKVLDPARPDSRARGRDFGRQEKDSLVTWIDWRQPFRPDNDWGTIWFDTREGAISRHFGSYEMLTKLE